MVTAGGVAFLSSTLDYYVRAYDETTGAAAVGGAAAGGRTGDADELPGRRRAAICRGRGRAATARSAPSPATT